MRGCCVYRNREIRKIENTWHIECIIDREFDTLKEAKFYVEILDEQNPWSAYLTRSKRNEKT